MKLVLGQIVTNVITLSSIIELTSFFLFLMCRHICDIPALFNSFWNTVSFHFMGQFTDFYCKAKKDFYFKELDFSVQLVQSLPRHYCDFKCF